MNQWTRNGENMKTHRMIRGRRAGGLSGQSASINGGGVAFSRRCFVRESDRATKLGHQKNLIVRGRESLRRKLIELIVRGREGLRRKLSRVLIYLREREREREAYLCLTNNHKLIHLSLKKKQFFSQSRAR
jgi:hypothetical protein